MSSAFSDSQKLWNAYQRATSRVHALERETDRQWSAYEVAVETEKKARAAAEVAWQAYAQCLAEAAVIAAAENVLLDIPHAGQAG